MSRLDQIYYASYPDEDVPSCNPATTNVPQHIKTHHAISKTIAPLHIAIRIWFLSRQVEHVPFVTKIKVPIPQESKTNTINAVG